MKRFLITLAFMFASTAHAAASPAGSEAADSAGTSAYTTRPADTGAVDFVPEKFPVLARKGADVSDALQAAIDRLKSEKNFGIVFIPEGTYRISKTIYVPPAVRLIGYGRTRPLIVLSANSPGFAHPDADDKGQGRYMIWFMGDTRKPGKPIPDAHPGTFYSGISNIDLRIEDGNPAAVALRTHFAQHGIVSHVDLHIENGKAGVFDVGNEMQDVRFFGGEYGIYTTKPSPGWPFMMLDTYFEGQRHAAIHSREAGLTIVRMQVKKVPMVLETEEGLTERLYIEDARFEDVSGPALVVSSEDNSFTQFNLRRIACRNVPVLMHLRESGREIKAPASIYRVDSLTHGQQMDSLTAEPSVRTTQKIEALAELPPMPRTDIPELPPVSGWVSVRNLGARGDGTTDDTKAIQAAIDSHPVVYFPSGWYRVSDTIRLRPDTVLIGLHPMATQLVVTDHTEAFAGFGAPKPLLDVPKGGNAIVTGIGLDAGGSNPRAVAAVWRSGARSYMNDVKFIGGHGTMVRPGQKETPIYNESRTADGNPARRWDSQYASLWVTDGGGGVFRNIWSASPYASAGFYVSDTSTPGRVYALSVEHHVRNEVVLRNIANWSFYDMQTEEEIAESQHSQPVEIADSHDLLFANLYTFRVIWLNTPYAQAIRTWGSRDIEFLNVHNFTQIKYTTTNTLVDMDSGTEVRPWELARLVLPHERAPKTLNVPAMADGTGQGRGIERLASGFEFADGMCSDVRGNVYFVDSRLKRIYQWSVEREAVRLLSETHWQPLSLACTRDGKLNVVAEYWPLKGAMLNGKPEVYPKPADAAGTSYAFWYRPATTRVYSIDPDHADASFTVLQPQASRTIANRARTLYPANRWRDERDYLEVTLFQPETSYLLSDGESVLPVYYDLLRSNALLSAMYGHPFYAVDEYMKRVVRFDVRKDGSLANPHVFANHGEFNLAVDENGKVYVPDGDIYVYAPDGSQIERIATPERPTTVAFAGTDGRTLYFASRGALYRIRR